MIFTPVVVKGAWGEVSQLLLCSGWRMILTGFVVLELGHFGCCCCSMSRGLIGFEEDSSLDFAVKELQHLRCCCCSMSRQRWASCFYAVVCDRYITLLIHGWWGLRRILTLILQCLNLCTCDADRYVTLGGNVLSEGTLDAATAGGALAEVIQLLLIQWGVIDIYLWWFRIDLGCCYCLWSIGRDGQMVFRTLVVIDICPCCCKCSIGRVGPAVVIQWLRGILTLIFSVLEFGHYCCWWRWASCLEH